MKQIHIRLTNVTEGWHDTDGVDVEATNSAYAAKLEAELQKAFPGAEVTVETNPNVYGSLSDSIVADSYEDEDDIRSTMAAISDRLMNDSESWTVLVSAS